MSRPLLLDLFCCEGLGAWGYHLAGFEVVGVDIVPRPRYPFRFVQADALRPPFRLESFDAIHASPPCQGYSTLRHLADREHPRLIGQVRDLLASAGVPYVIENVEGARDSMRDPVVLCGSSFGLRVRRHRLFEANVALLSLPCAHGRQGTPLGVYGTGGGGPMTRGVKASKREGVDAMGGGAWASWYGLTQGIPPAFTQHIGSQLLAHLGVHA